MIRYQRRALLTGIAALLTATAAAGAQSDEPFVPLAGGVRGMQPQEFLAAELRGDSLIGTRDYAATAMLYEQITSAYPWNGENWRRLGVALQGTGQHLESARAFVKAAALGVSPYPMNVALNAAREFSRAGERDSALFWLRKTVVDYAYNRLPWIQADSAFLPLRDDPRFREIARLTAVPQSRDDGWRYDVNFLLDEIRRMNPVYSHRPLPPGMAKAGSDLLAAVPRLSDAQIVVEMQRIVSMMKQSHNTVFFPGLESDARVRFATVPLTFYPFVDGLFITDAAPQYADLIGAKVLKFDGTSADKAVAALRPLYAADSAAFAGSAPTSWVSEPHMNGLTLPAVLHAVGATRDSGKYTLTIVDRDGRQREVSPVPGTFARARKIQASKVPGVGPAPLYLSHPDDFYWYAPLPGDGGLYVQFNQVVNRRDANREGLPAFGRRLRAVLDSGRVRDLVIDVRRNNGGDTYFYTELLRTLVRFDADTGHRLVVIAGRYTFSAAMNFITDVNRLTNAVFVGEPSGGSPIQIGGDESISSLPYSRVQMALASRSWQLTSPGDARRWITPDMPVEITSRDYFANRDPVLNTVLGYLKRQPVF